MESNKINSLGTFIYEKNLNEGNKTKNLKAIISAYEAQCKEVLSSCRVNYYGGNIHEYLCDNFSTIKRLIRGMDIDGIDNFSYNFHSYIMTQCEGDASFIKLVNTPDEYKPMLYPILNALRSTLKDDNVGEPEMYDDPDEDDYYQPSRDNIRCESLGKFILRFYKNPRASYDGVERLVKFYSNESQHSFGVTGLIASGERMDFGRYVGQYGETVLSLIRGRKVSELEDYSRGYINYLEDIYRAEARFDSLSDSEIAIVADILRIFDTLTPIGKNEKPFVRNRITDSAPRLNDAVTDSEVDVESVTVADAEVDNAPSGISVGTSSEGITVNITNLTLKLDCNSELLTNLFAEIVKCNAK